ncbi:MAG: ATP-binding domain-containing protein, partial [Candidatus Muiribacteriota bacterium]
FARRAIKKNKKTLFVCFNKNISIWIKSQFCEDDFQYLEISNLHSMMRKFTNSGSIDNGDSEYWTEKLPEEAINALLGKNNDEDDLYDSLIIDEAQDVLRQPYLDFLDLCLKDGISSGNWFMFGDFVYQKIYNYSDNMSINEFLNKSELSVPVYYLGINCRNTPRIAAYAPVLGGLQPDYIRILRADDKVRPELLYFKETKEQQKLLKQLLTRFQQKEKFKPRDIVVLSPFSNTSCASKLEKSGESRLKLFRINEDYGNKVSFSTIHSYKGLESPVVIITDIREIKDKEMMNLIYVGLTRALSRLVIIMQENVREDIKKLLGVT